MKKKLLLLALFIIYFTLSKAQINITGTIKLDPTGEPAIGAQIWIDSLSKGTTTNEKGDFIISDVKGNRLYTFIITYLGYKRYEKKIYITLQDSALDITLLPIESKLEQITIEADKLIDQSSVSDVSLNVGDVKSKQGLWEDPIRVIATLPGISKGSNNLFSTSQLYVRGGSPEENLFLFDNTKVSWPWYFGGIKSIFNLETIENLELLTGGYTAKYGNAMSSVLRVTTRNGNFNSYHGNFSFGFSNMQASLEGPIIKEKLSFLVSVRKTYLDFFLKKGNSSIPISNFGDATYKISFKLNDKHQLSLSGLSGFEKVDFFTANPKPGETSIIETNGITHTQSLQWRSLWTRKLYSNLSIVNASTDAKVEIGRNLNFTVVGYNTGLREDFSYLHNSKITINWGGELNLSQATTKGNTPLDPFEADPNDSTIVLRTFNYSDQFKTSAVYLTPTINLFEKISITPGIRIDHLFKTNNTNFSPRFSIAYQIAPYTKIRGAYGYFYQFPNTNTGASSLRSSLCTHYIIGIQQNFSHSIKGWIEFYYKDYSNLVTYDSTIQFNNDGKGYSKGIELFLSKEKGKFRGWISYALSEAKRREALQQKIYFFEYDKRHMFNFAVEYHTETKKWFIPALFSAQFRFETGNPYTPVISAEKTNEGWKPIKGEINSNRNPNYHNLNIRIEWHFNISKKIRGISFFEFWNVYNQKNTLGRTYQYGNQYPNYVLESPYYSTPLLNAGGFKIEF